MHWKFIAKAEVTNLSNHSFKRVMLTIGIACFLFALAVEVTLNNKSAWFFVVPLLYLVSLRNQISRKKIILDVPMIVTLYGTVVEIVFNNTIRNKTGSFSEKYSFNVSDVRKCNYVKKYRELQILTNCEYQKIGNSSAEIGKTRTRNIRFMLTKEIEENLLNELKKQITINYFD